MMERARSFIAYAGKDDDGDTLASRVAALIRKAGRDGITRATIKAILYADRPRTRDPDSAIKMMISHLRREGTVIHHTGGIYRMHQAVVLDVPKKGYIPTSANQALSEREAELLKLLRMYAEEGIWISTGDLVADMKPTRGGRPIDSQNLSRMMRNMGIKGITIQHKNAGDGTATLLYRLAKKDDSHAKENVSGPTAGDGGGLRSSSQTHRADPQRSIARP